MRLTAEHVPQVAAIARESYSTPWSESIFHAELGNAVSHFYVGLVRDKVIGYGGFWLVAGEAEILSVTIAPAYRGKGLGKALMRFLLEEAIRQGADRAVLEVRESNSVARGLYRSLGFREVGLRKGYYDDGREDAVLMACQLASTRDTSSANV